VERAPSPSSGRYPRPEGISPSPVTQHTKRFIRCFWALDRELANARHYPAVSWTDSYSEYALEVEDWWDRVDPDWKNVRGRALELLKREQRLQEIVRLIGPDALPDEQRLVLITADMVKTGFLQQSSFDMVDRYCSPVKEVLLLRCIMEFHRRAELSIKVGAPLPKITALPVREKIVRLKSEVPNDKPEEIRACEREIEAAFDEIDRQYRKEGIR